MAQIIASHGQLTAATTGLVTLSDAMDCVTVTCRGTTGLADIFFTVASENGQPKIPTVAGADCYVVPGVNGASKTVWTGDAPVNVMMISSGTPGFSVEGGLPTLVHEL